MLTRSFSTEYAITLWQFPGEWKKSTQYFKCSFSIGLGINDNNSDGMKTSNAHLLSLWFSTFLLIWKQVISVMSFVAFYTLCPAQFVSPSIRSFQSHYCSISHIICKAIDFSKSMHEVFMLFCMILCYLEILLTHSGCHLGRKSLPLYKQQLLTKSVHIEYSH